jgi:hypothetical protein
MQHLRPQHHRPQHLRPQHRRRVTATAAVLAVCVLAVLAALAGCGGPGSGATPTAAPSALRSGLPASGGPATGASDGRSWIVSGATLTRLLAADTAGRTTARNFDTPHAYVLTGAGDWAVPHGWSSTPTASFSSWTALQSAFARHTLDPRIRAVLYDNEHWSLTPAAEQADPAHYDQLAAQLVHQHHLLFIAAPATDLVKQLRPDATTGAFDTYLSLGLAGDIASSADVLDLQAQGAEDNPTLFASFVSAAAAQARRAHPGVVVLAGISTNPSGTPVTAAVIDRSARAVQADVDGYWLNDPAASPACPSCTGPFPRVALAAVSRLGGR